jgi:hypothetical protein
MMVFIFCRTRPTADLSCASRSAGEMVGISGGLSKRLSMRSIWSLVLWTVRRVASSLRMAAAAGASNWTPLAMRNSRGFFFNAASS